MDWYPISQETLDRAKRFSDQINEDKGHLPSTREWSGNDSHFQGLVAEYLVGHILGIKVNEEVLKAGDGKMDFPNIDVKASSYWREPHLRVFPEDTKRQDINFVLVAIDLKGMRARVCGWASPAMLAHGHVIDYGYGTRYVLYEDELLPGLPFSASTNLDGVSLVD